MTTQAIEEYLEAIYHLREVEHPVRLARIAERLNVSPAAVADMLARLTKEGLVERTVDRGVGLTTVGESLATRQVSRHRLAARLLYDLLGLRWDRTHEDACRLEHVISPEAADGLERLLNNPRTCPHGKSDPGQEWLRERDSIPPACRARARGKRRDRQDHGGVGGRHARPAA